MEHVVVELVYKFEEVLPQMFEKVSQSHKYDSIIPQTCEYVYIYMDTSPKHITHCSCMCMRGKIMHKFIKSF